MGLEEVRVRWWCRRWKEEMDGFLREDLAAESGGSGRRWSEEFFLSKLSSICFSSP